MSASLSTGLVVVLGLLTLLQIAQAVFIIRWLRTGLTAALADEECPPAMVVLCLRGGDPFLERSIRALIAQDYPDYRLRIMVDSPGDSAHSVLQGIWGTAPPAHVEVLSLTSHRATCSFKMSGILDGTAVLPPGVAIVALMDGDTIPHSTWLRELAAPIVRRGAAVTTGHRWYSPDRPSLGSMCRFWWNAGAIPQMSFFHMPWGGTMALRAEVIADIALRDRIGHACSEDTSTGEFARERGLKVYFEPSLLIVNREEIGLVSFFEFETRQLLFTRLEFARYRAMASFGLLTLPLAVYPLARLLGLRVDTLTDIAFVVYFLATWSGVFLLGMTVRGILARRQESVGRWDARRWFWASVAAAVTPILHLAAVIRAALMRQVRWRGVWYRVGAQPRVQVIRDDWVLPDEATPVAAIP